MTTTHEVFAALGDAIARRVGEVRYRLWFTNNVKFEVQGSTLRAGFPNRFFLEWVQAGYEPALLESAREVLGRSFTLQCVVDAELFQAHRNRQPAAAEPAPAVPLPAFGQTRSATRRWLQLDDFVVGPCNHVAYRAAQRVVAGGEGYPNPLVLHGPVGMGKTHLLEGVAAGLAQRCDETRVVVITAEEFTNRFIQAIHDRQLRDRKLADFRKQFRQAHGLLVDDVQFFANKKATQAEFLHTFESLVQRGRPVVLAADRHPRVIDQLLPELTDRLLGGVVAGLDAPDRVTRSAIVKARAARLRCDMPDDVAGFLADQLHGNVRELHGAVHAVHHHSLALNRPVTVDLARAAAADLLRPGLSAKTLRDVERALCGVLGLEARVLRSETRAQAISRCRMLAMHLMRKHTQAAFSEIGKHYCRNHSTALAADKKVRQWLAAKKPLNLGGQRWELLDLVERVDRQLT